VDCFKLKMGSFKIYILIFLFAFTCLPSKVNAQVYTRYEIINGDTVPIFDLPTITVGKDYSKKPAFKNKRQSYKYRKLTAYVKKVYPYANLASQKLNECEEKIKNNPEERKKAMRNAEKELRKKYGKAMKRLTVTQGKILLLLIDRQTGFTTFELVQELRGDFSASMYQGLALLFGSTLKINYDPKGEHWMIEDIVTKIEKGIL